MFLSLEVRSYERDTPHHHHDHAQLVLPIRGRMDIDVNGRGGCIDQSLAALVEPGSEHSQHCDIDSRFLVLDCAPSTLETPGSKHLCANPPRNASAHRVRRVDRSCATLHRDVPAGALVVVLPEPGRYLFYRPYGAVDWSSSEQSWSPLEQ
jgi:hypothetical protein